MTQKQLNAGTLRDGSFPPTWVIVVSLLFLSICGKITLYSVARPSRTMVNKPKLLPREPEHRLIVYFNDAVNEYVQDPNTRLIRRSYEDYFKLFASEWIVHNNLKDFAKLAKFWPKSELKKEELLPVPVAKFWFVIMPHGSKYHLPSCRYCNENGIVTVSGEGYEPCKVCKPDLLENIIKEFDLFRE